MKRAITMAGVVSLALGGSVAAQEIQLDPIIILGETEVEAENTGKAYTVITGEQLQQNQVRYVADALRQVPGFAVSRTGSYGGLTQVRVRGAEANHLLVMIDGVEASETSAGEFDFGSLLVTDIERIEVLRGPQSAFWGSNATAGVVNIVTKRGERNGFRVDARSEAGTDGAFLGGVSLSGGRDNFDVALSGTFRRTDGFDISSDNSGPFGGEEDGDRNTTLNGKATWDVTSDLKLDGTLRFVDRRSELDDQDFRSPDTPTQGLTIDTLDEVATREFFGSVGATYVALDGALTQKLRLTGSDAKREGTDADILDYANTGSRLNGSYQAAYAFETLGFANAKHTITGGYEWERETFETLPPVFSPTQLGERERQTSSFVGEYRGEFLDQYFVTAALRRDLNDEFQDATTYSVSGAWRIPGTGTRLHSSVGTGVTNPTFFEQFGFDPDTFIGNPDLIPEESFGWDIGVEPRLFGDQLVVDLTYFNQDLT
ncbi:MAG: TonB-dependent receptor plug domain-containing protein, partial [Rhizobiaceae bacterium]